ncbi:hypothetical protein HLB23_31400 [Nocardia uniformis]|uniref:Uncharacterized protein n=1 Tax=Nocardia uniformis TaxID=53432 RepID=A0A849C6K6_9NOCA|nr:hypothetical protein [Nocardia uniformis]NNH74304.1 hypothetical protein [Nocardia uniformis]
MSIGNRISARPRIRMSSGTGARGRVVVAGVAALVGAAVLAAPNAAGTATRVGVEPGISFGPATNYGTGCSYPVNAYVNDPVTPVVFYDNGIAFAVAHPSGAIATAHWAPATPGAHRLQVIQHSAPGEDVVPYVDLRVGTGLHSGSGCIVLH